MSRSSASLTLAPLTADTAEPAATGALEATARRLGFVPNMYGYMAYAPDLLNTYLAGYEGFRRNSGFTPAEQETVFLAVSEANGCDYCVAAHSMIAEKMSKVPSDSIAALRKGGGVPAWEMARRSAPAIASPSSGTIYVSGSSPSALPTGNDTTGDGSEAAPYATLTKALSIVPSGGVTT